MSNQEGKLPANKSDETREVIIKTEAEQAINLYEIDSAEEEFKTGKKAEEDNASVLRFDHRMSQKSYSKRSFMDHLERRVAINKRQMERQK